MAQDLQRKYTVINENGEKVLLNADKVDADLDNFVNGFSATPQKIRVATKEGKTGTIPASQLKKALSLGYTLYADTLSTDTPESKQQVQEKIQDNVYTTETRDAVNDVQNKRKGILGSLGEALRGVSDSTGTMTAESLDRTLDNAALTKDITEGANVEYTPEMIDTQKQHRELSDRVNAELRQRTEVLLDQEYVTSINLQESDKLLERAAGFYNPDPYGRSRAIQLNDDRHKNLSAAKNMLDDSDKIIDAVNALADGEMIVGQTFRGIKDGAFDFDTWSFGLTDLLDVSSLRKAAEKAERGEELTDDEEMLLDAAATDMAVNYYYASSLSRGYKAGKVTGESLPFMLEMAINPLSKSGDVLAKGMLKHIKKKALGRTVKDASGKIIKHGYKSALNNKTLKWGAQIVGDVAGAAGMTLTTGQASTLADTQKRMMGEATFNYDEDGNLKFAGMVGGEGSWLDAYGKAFGAKTIENYSEMLGEYFSPIFSTIGDVARKGVSKIGLGNVLKNVENGINKGLFGPSVRDFMKATRWDGVLSEFAEEQAGGILNALIVGDQTLDTDEDTGVFNKDNMIDTFLGVSILGGVMSTISTLGYRNPVTRAKQDLILADARAKKHFGEDKWQEIVTNVGNYDLSDIGEQHEASKIADEMDDDGKRLFWEYLGAEMKLNGVMLGERERKLFFAKDPMAKELEMIYDEYSEGITPENRNNLLHSEKIIASSPLSRQYKDTSVEELVEIYKANPNDEMAQYIKARQADLSYREYLKSQKGEAVRDYSNEISSMSFKGEGKEVREVALKNGIKGYILDETNDSITVVGEDGNKYIVSTSEIAAQQTRAKEELVKEFSDSYESGIDTHLNSLYSAPTDEEVVEQEVKLDNQITSLKPNDTVLLKQDDDTIVEGKVEQVDTDNGLYWVKTKEGGIMQMSKEELESAIVPGNANEHKEDKGEGEQPKPAPMPKPQPPLGPNGGAPQQGGQIPPQTPQVPEEEVDELEGYYRDEEKKKVDYDKLLEEKPEVFIDVYGNKNGEDATISAIDVKIKAINEQIKKAEKAKSKKTSLNDIEDINDEIAEHNKKIETLEGLKKGVIQKKAQADAEKAKQEAIQAGGKQTEITFGEVPDVSEDKSSDARERGYRVSEGVRIDRQEPIDKREGKETNVSFATGKSQGGKFVLIDANSATPSHINGKINLRHFLPEAQPKDRVDKASQSAREDIAKNINPGEITRGETAYSGSPVVNSRGEVIQGNGRTDALQYMYESFPEQAQKYKQFLIDNAAEFGLNPADIESMESPMLVRMVDVDDNTAIGLGQHTASDLESGGVQSLRSNEISNMLGNDLGNVSDMLLETEDEDASLSSVIGSNGKKALQYLLGRGIINNTQYQSAFNEEGELTSEAIESLKGVLQSALFTNAPDNIKKWFAKLPKSAQKALLQVAHRDMMSGESDRIMEDIQSAIQLYYQLSMDADFAKVKTVEDFDNYVKNLWGQQTNLFAEGVPIEKFSKFAVELAKHFKFKKEKELKAIYNELFDTIQGVEDLFGNNAPLSKEEAIKEIFNIDYGTEEQQPSNTANKEGGSGVLVQDDTEGSSGGQGSKTGDTVTGGTKEEGQPSGPSGASAGGSSEDVSGSAEEVGSKDKKDGKKEESKPTSIFEEAEEIAAEEEVKEEGEEIAAEEDKEDTTLTAEEDENIILTEEEIRNSGEEDAELIELAVDFINGDKSFSAELAYNKILNNVRKSRNISATGDSKSELPSHLGSGNNETGLDREGQSGMEAVGMVEGDSRERVSGIPVQRGSGTTDQRGVDTSSRVGSDTDVSGEESSDMGSGDRLLRNGRRSNTSNGDGVHDDSRKRDNRKGEKSNEKAVRAEDSTRLREIDAAINEDLADLEALFGEFKNAGKSTLNISVVGMTPEQIEIAAKILAKSVKLGYNVARKGFYHFEQFAKKVKDLIGSLLHSNLGYSDAEIDEFIQECWDTKITINGVRKKVSEFAAEMKQEELRKETSKLLSEKKAEQDKAESITEYKVCDKENIDATLPFLLPDQRLDVVKAETQFFDESHNDREHAYGKGFLFTNGTGTGKTYTGLGIAKRFDKMGKKRILILTPSQPKVSDWVKAANNLNFNLKSLVNTKDKGKDAVITTFANFRTNKELLSETWDLVIYDESHKIMEGKDAAETLGAKVHYQITNRDIESALLRLQSNHPLWNEEKELRKERELMVSQLSKVDDSEYDKLQKHISKKDEEIATIVNAQNEVLPKMRQEAENSVKQTKVLFLSATPFNTIENIEYAERYIFTYPEEDKNTIGGRNHKKGADLFKLNTFGSGYQWRYGRVEKSVSNQDSFNRQQVAFADHLMNNLKTVSFRAIDNGYDYSRNFPIVNLEHANLFNKAFEDLNRNPDYAPIVRYFSHLWNYNWSSFLFESMKVSAALPRIKEHLAMGRKVVIFHRRKEAPGESKKSGDNQSTPLPPMGPPFATGLQLATNAIVGTNNSTEREKMQAAISKFYKEYRDLLNWEKTLDYRSSREQLIEAFATDEDRKKHTEALKKYQEKYKDVAANKRPAPPTLKASAVGLFSGTESKSAREKDVDSFNDDNGKNIIIVQEASGKEGISLHDTTGKHQRVLISLALPQSPITFIQQEGRIFRIGNKTNAIFEYPLLGLNLEIIQFASKINNSAQMTENLAYGSQGRALGRSINYAVLNESGVVPLEGQGFGGIEKDRRNESDGLKGYDAAIADYHGTRKRRRNDEELGIDYFPTPEPIGYKMAQWGNIMEGDKVLEPSAGHGAIARYVPTQNRLTVIEPSHQLRAQLELLVGGVNVKSEDSTFENYYVGNKHDVILMNPPYGASGKTAMEHLEKAWKHLSDSGRLIAVIPSGPSMDKRMEKWLSDKETESLVQVAEILLPSVTFGKAGTSVMTKVVVFDKLSRPETRKIHPTAKNGMIKYDFTKTEKIEELFEQLRDIELPDRVIDKLAKYDNAIERNKATFEANKKAVDYVWRGNTNDRTGTPFEIFRIRTKGIRNWTHGKTSADFIFIEDVNNMSPIEANYLQSNARRYNSYQEMLDLYADAENDPSGEKMKEFRKKISNYSWDQVSPDRFEAIVDYYAAANKLFRDIYGLSENQIKRVAKGLHVNPSSYEIGETLTMDDIKTLFEYTNGVNDERMALFNKVFDVAKTLNMNINVFEEWGNVLGSYTLNSNTLEINAKKWNDPRLDNETRAHTLLHELIHSVTSYALHAYERGIDLPQNIKNACSTLNEVADLIQKGPESRHFAGEYALVREGAVELVAELSKPSFREKLKKRNLWVRIVDAFRQLFGMPVSGAEQTTALAEADRALNELLDNFDLNVHKRIRDTFNNVYWYFSDNMEYYKEIPKNEYAVLYSNLMSRFQHNTVYGVVGNTSNYSYICDYFGDSLRVRAIFKIDADEQTKQQFNRLTYKRDRLDKSDIVGIFDNIRLSPRRKSGDVDDTERGGTSLRNDILASHELREESEQNRDNGHITEDRWISVKTGYDGSRYARIRFVDESELNDLSDSYDDYHFRTSKELDEEFGNAWREQQNEDGRHSTQVAKTKSTYEKIGRNLSEKGLKDVSILDASSGLGLGTQALRDMGFKVDDVEPYPSESREKPTFDNYADIDKKYDVVISNAVLNVIPDDWRADVLHKMADVVNDGGKIIINTRPASQISTQGTEGKTRITLDSPSEILVKRGGKIAAYQKGFTTQELIDWVSSELGEGWKVEKATVANSGISGEGSVVVTKEVSPEDKHKAQVQELSRELVQSRIQKHAEKIGIKVKFVSKEELPKGHKNAQGMFNPKTQEISICLDNHKSVDDAIVTLMHEAVGHYGLRKLVGEKNFDKFLWSVYENATEEVRGKIIEISREKGFIGRDMTDAIEEYLSRLAEDTALYEQSKESGFFDKIKELFNNLLKKILGYGGEITDEDLRYLLIRSYDNLNDPNGKGGIFDTARDIAVKEKLGLSERDGVQYRTSSNSLHFREVEDEIKQSNYDKRLSEKSYKVQEAYQDSMLGLKVLQEEIEKESGKKLKDYENAYMFENTVSSRNRYEQDNFKVKYQLPMINAISKLMAKGFTYEDIKLYAMAKSGLERNDVFAMRDATKIYDEAVKELDGEIAQRMSEAERNLLDSGDNAKYQKEVDKIEKYRKNRLDTLEKQRQKNYEKFRGNDYSALTSLFEADSLSESEELAQGYVSKIENGSTAEIADFWDKVNAASDYSLKKNLNSGLLSQSMYDKISSMFNYYVPMRDFEEDTAEDLYDYYTQPMSKFNAPLKAAKGRTSEYKDPFATICNMADSAILQSHKNMMKQRFVAMALNNKGSKYLKVSNRWIVKTNEVDADGRPIWEEKLPEIPENATPEEITQILNDFEESMNTMKAEGNAQVVTSRTKLPFRVVKKAHISEHMVSAKIGGDIYNVYVLGNPRAAQAVNGLTNPATDNKVLQKIQKANRFVAANYTTMSPKFIMRNAMRDLLYSSFSINIKEDEEYGKLFRKNRAKMIFGEGYMFTLMRKFSNGTLDPNNETDKLFLEFMKNGGETGYSLLRDVEEFQKMNTDLLKQLNDNSVTNKIKNGGKAIIDGIEFTNRCVENLCRFTVYMTSRQYGRSIDKSIADAKNISVNFNKKGSGQGYGAGFFRHAYLFFNAGMQGLTNFISLAKSNPKKFAKRTAAWVGWGAVMPMVNTFISSLFGDDDDYWDLPEWIRRNNFCFKLPFGSNYVTIPLPIELRALYGIGETVGTALMGKAPHSNIAGDIIMQVLDVMPFNMLEGVNTSNESIGKTIAQNMMPDIIAPTVDAVIFNKDFTGRPIYKDYDYNRYDPEFTKAYKGTSRYLIQFTEFINRLSGGDKYTKGAVDLNPAVIEYMAEGYLGGRLTMLNEIAQTIGSIVEQDVEVRDIPFANIVLQHNDERTTSSYVNELYYYYKQEHDANVRRLNKYKKDPDMIDEYYELNDEYALRREIYDKYQNSIDDMKKKMQKYQDNGDKDMAKYYQELIEEEKRTLVEMMLEFE